MTHTCKDSLLKRNLCRGCEVCLHVWACAGTRVHEQVHAAQPTRPDCHPP